MEEEGEKMFKCINCLRNLSNKKKGNLYRKVFRFVSSEEKEYVRIREKKVHLNVCKNCMQAYIEFLNV